jgi:hypothetical protein
MKFYIITDRQLREIVRVVGEEARRPLLEFIKDFMSEVRAVVEDMAEMHKGVDGDDAPPIAPRN